MALSSTQGRLGAVRSRRTSVKVNAAPKTSTISRVIVKETGAHSVQGAQMSIVIVEPVPAHACLVIHSSSLTSRHCQEGQ
jgi:hypothetical protein